jgi:hypothetical protein
MYLLPMCSLFFCKDFCTLASSTSSIKHSPLGLPSLENVKCTPFSPPTTAISSEKNNLPSLHLQDFTELSATGRTVHQLNS